MFTMGNAVHTGRSTNMTVPVTDWDKYLSGWDLGNSTLQLVKAAWNVPKSIRTISRNWGHTYVSKLITTNTIHFAVSKTKSPPNKKYSNELASSVDIHKINSFPKKFLTSMRFYIQIIYFIPRSFCNAIDHLILLYLFEKKLWRHLPLWQLSLFILQLPTVSDSHATRQQSPTVACVYILQLPTVASVSGWLSSAVAECSF